jgi:hypothetical protein
MQGPEYARFVKVNFCGMWYEHDDRANVFFSFQFDADTMKFHAEIDHKHSFTLYVKYCL